MTDEEIMNNKVFCLKNNSGVVGEIIERNKFYIGVEIILPYRGWRNGLSISGPGRRTPHHFLTKRGDEVAQDLLKESYAKLKFLDNNFDSIVRTYFALQNDIKVLECISSKEARDRIKWRLEGWFWCHNIFHSNQTGLIASYHDREVLQEIFEIYRKTGKKVFSIGINNNLCQ